MELSNLEEAVSGVEYEKICEEPVYVRCEGEPFSLPDEVTLTIRADDARTLGINLDNLTRANGYANIASTNNYVTREDVQRMIDEDFRRMIDSVLTENGFRRGADGA